MKKAPAKMKKAPMKATAKQKAMAQAILDSPAKMKKAAMKMKKDGMKMVKKSAMMMKKAAGMKMMKKK